MRARRLLPALLVLTAVTLGATGCFESKVSDTTISGEVTIGQGSTAQTVNPSEGGTTATSSEETTSETSTGETESSESTSGGATGGDVAAGKAAFSATCGGCHTLKAAGTHGQVGPDLDSLGPLTAETVAKQIENGGGAMPAKLLTGKDAENVAAYVASIAGK
jgi:cytochrome c551